MIFVMESWQSGNAPDSKSGEPSFPWRAGSNPVLSLYLFKKTVTVDVTVFFVYSVKTWHKGKKARNNIYLLVTKRHP